MNLLRRGEGKHVLLQNNDLPPDPHTLYCRKKKRNQKSLQPVYEFSTFLPRWLEEIDRRQAEMVAAQIALEKLRQRDQLLQAENEMLKVKILPYGMEYSFEVHLMELILILKEISIFFASF